LKKLVVYHLMIIEKCCRMNFMPHELRLYLFAVAGCLFLAFPVYAQSILEQVYKQLGGNFFHHDYVNNCPDPWSFPGRHMPDSRLTVMNRTGYENIYRFRTQPGEMNRRVTNYYSDSGVILPYSLWKAPGSSSIVFKNRRTGVDWGYENSSFSLTREVQEFLFSCNQTLLRNRIRLFGLWGIKNSSGRRLNDYRFDMNISPISWMTLGWNVKQNSLNILTEYDYEDNLIDIPLALSSRQKGYTFAFHSKFLDITSKFNSKDILYNERFKDQADYFLEPNVTLENMCVVASISPCSPLAINIGYRNRKGEGDAYAYYQNQRFSKITRILYDDEIRAAGIICRPKGHHTIEANYTRTAPYFYGRGHVDSWPFTSTLIDLLGMRGYFKGEIKADIKKYSILYHMNIRDKSKINFKCDYFAIYPEGYLLTWRPAFLVFGVADLKRHAVDIEYIRLLSLQMFYDLSISGINIHLSLHQYIPISTKKTTDREQTPVKPAVQSGTKGKSNGGTSISLTLSYDFPQRK